MKPSLLVVVINWRNEEEVIYCLRQLRLSLPERSSVIVVDNESSDESQRTFKGCSDLYDFYEARDQNLGFVGGCNIGLQIAHKHGFDHVGFLNTDAELDTNCLAGLQQELSVYPECALVSPVLLSSETKLPYFCGSKIDTKALTMRDITSDEMHESYGTETVFHGLGLHGTVLMANTQHLWSLGGFDERYFAYYEDTDLSQRALSAGFDCRVVSEAHAFHPDGRTRDGGTRRSAYFHYYMTRNGIRFWRAHAEGLGWLKAIFWEVSRAKRAAKELQALGHDQEAKSIWAGIVDGLLGRSGIWKKHP